MFRRRSRGHYDPQQYNTGIPTRSASASAAANAFYQQKLGAGAAAEALRRHSLDQAGSAAIQQFQPSAQYQPALTPPSLGHNARRNSINARSNRTPSSLSRPASVLSPPRRANSLSSANYSPLSSSSPAYRAPTFTNSPPVSRSIQPTSVAPASRRNSLQRANSLTRTTTVVNRDASGRTMSLTTTTVRQMGSFELVSTKDVPIQRANSFSRANSLTRSPGPHSPLAQPQRVHAELEAPSIHSIDSELHGIEEEPEESWDSVNERFNKLVDHPSEIEKSKIEKNETERSSTNPGNSANSTNPGNSANSANPANSADPANSANSETNTAYTTNSALADPSRLANQTTELDDPIDLSDGTVSEVSTSPQSRRASYREPSPARSAFRNSNSHTKAKVSFGGADPAYVYESYDYTSLPTESAPSPHLAAAAAAVRTRSNQKPVSAAARPFGQPHVVQKRPSTASLTGRTSISASKAASRSRLDSEDDILPVPARSAARPPHSPVMASSQTFASPEPAVSEPAAPENDIRAQALALVQQQFVQADYKLGEKRPESDTSRSSASPAEPSKPAHLYRGLVDDDAASVHSSSSFTRERGSRASQPSRMRSLRQPATPSLRQSQPGNRQSLLNQSANGSSSLGGSTSLGGSSGVNSSKPSGSSKPNGSKPHGSEGFRKFSLRGAAPDLGLDERSPAMSPNFTSRFADSDSEDEGGKSFFKKSSNRPASKGSAPNKISLGHVFSPNTDVKDLFNKNNELESQRIVSTTSTAGSKPKKKNIFKRMFGRKKDA